MTSTILHTLYCCFIAPIEFLMRLTLEWSFSLTHSWGVSLVLLSLAVNTAILPIYNWAERWQEAERALRRGMARQEGMIHRTFRGGKRFALLSTLRRQHGYGYGFTLRASVGLLLQIPFFFAAYHLLSHFTALEGQAFIILSDLAAPDGLLTVHGYSLNLLPLLMTVVNLCSAFIYTNDLNRRDRVQIYGIALVFLFLLYNAASSLTLYWTLNNLYSLCKNVIEKNLIRRSTWQRIWSILCFNKHVEHMEEGTRLRYSTRLRMAAHYSFGIGAIFWIYTSTLAFSRHGLLDSEFLWAVRHLAEQCILIAFYAMLAMSVVIRSDWRRRTNWNSILIVVSISTLFLLELNFFQGGLKITNGFFSFTIEGFIWSSYIFWLFVILCIQKYRNTLITFWHTLYHVLFVHLTERGDDSADSPEPIVPSNRETLILAGILGAVCSLFLWYFVPFSTYFHNVNEFDFKGWELCGKVTPYFGATAVILFLFLGSTAFFLPYECVYLPWKKRARTGAKVNILHVFFCIFLIAFLLEGTLLSYNLPVLAGEKRLFDSLTRTIVDITIWLNLIILWIKFWRKLAKSIYLIIALITLFSFTALFDFYRGRGEKIDPTTFTGINGLYIVDAETLYSRLCFSKTDNTIVILVDSLDTLAFEKTLEIYPELKKNFAGFWLFRENLGAGGHTIWAMPQIFSGKIFDEYGKFNDFTGNSVVGLESMAADAFRTGRKVFIDSIQIVVSDESNPEIITSYRHRMVLTDYIKVLFFRFLPYFGKSLFEDAVNFNNKDFDSSLTENDDNQFKFHRLTTRIDRLDETKVFQFIHFFGVHPPFTKGNVIETTKSFIQDFSIFINKLSEFDIYKKTTIVILADHGIQSSEHDHRKFYPERNWKYPTFYAPLFMIKTQESTGDMIVHDTLMSSIYLRGILNSFYKYGSTNTVLEQYISSLPATRYIYIAGSAGGKFEVQGNFSNMSMKKMER